MYLQPSRQHIHHRKVVILVVTILLAILAGVFVVKVSAAPLPPPEWDKSSIEVTGQCLPDGRAEFVITNGGADMGGPSAWREYEADVLTADGTFQLAAGAAQVWTFGPQFGIPIRFEADQRPGHPGASAPRLTLTCEKPTAVTLSAFTAAPLSWFARLIAPAPFQSPQPVPCFFARVLFTDILDRDEKGKPVTWYVYFMPPGQTRMERVMTFYPDYQPGDWFQQCGVTYPWGEWQRKFLPVIWGRTQSGRPAGLAAPTLGTMGGCVSYVGRCKISADGAGRAASTICRDGRHFEDAHVATYRAFDPDSYYRVLGCEDGYTGIRNVRITYKIK